MNTLAHNLNHLLSVGVQALRQRDLFRADQTFQKVLQHAPDEPHAIFFLGEVRRLTRDYPSALAYMEKALATHSNPSEVRMAMGKIYSEQAEYVKAAKAYEEAIKLNPKDISLFGLLGAALQSSKNWAGAEAAYRRALQLDAKHFPSLYYLAICLREQYRPADALSVLEKALQVAPRAIEPHYAAANVHYDLGNFEMADKHYRIALQLNPSFVEAHVSLNKLYWQYGKKDLYTKSYQIGIEADPQNVALCANHLAALEKNEDLSEACSFADKYQKQFPSQPAINLWSAHIHSKAGNADKATSLFETALRIAPNDASIRSNAAEHFIMLGLYETALEHLTIAQNISPDDQAVWANTALCWRLLGDTRYEWLCDYEKFVVPTMLEPPKGYTSLEEFLSELKSELRTLHFANHEPPDQSLRGGTQTYGNLLDRPEPILQAFRAELKKPIQAYLDALPDDPEHPLCRRKTGAFDFSASWSVWLRGGGFHVNHHHPMGWISSAFYVDVPESSAEEHRNKEGWIKFGESSLMLGERDKPCRFVEPQSGMLVLFPSYMWHGTVAYTKDADRITAPFDVVPSQPSIKTSK